MKINDLICEIIGWKDCKSDVFDVGRETWHVDFAGVGKTGSLNLLDLPGRLTNEDGFIEFVFYN
jgi:hypothetical protein